jgi:hypothetical protein
MSEDSRKPESFKARPLGEDIEKEQAEKDKKAEEGAKQEKSLEKMEALLRQSAMGIHILFQNQEIAEALKGGAATADFFDLKKMKKVQDVMTELIAKPTYYDKLAFIQELEPEAYQMLVRTYFHIVENTVRANQDANH